MKKLSVLLVLLSLNANAQVLIGTVNVPKVVSSIGEGKKIREKLQKFFQEKQGMLKKEDENIKKAQADYEKKKTVLNEATRAKTEKELRGKFMKLQEKSMKYQQEIQKMENELKRPLLEKINKILTKVSIEKKVDLTVEQVIYAKNSIDLTELVIESYNKQYPTKK